MGADANCHFELERINAPDKIPLDKPNHTYTCGRAKDNEIVCPSLTVSRRHCIFFRSRDELFITDLKSANGVFINGVLQSPLQTILLHLNDIIGIGCSETDVKDKNMFVFRLSLATQPQLMEIVSASALSETVLNSTNALEICTSNGKLNGVVKRKREDRNHDRKVSPNKIPKLQLELTKEKSCLEKNSEESEIEIIHVLLNNSVHNTSNDSCDNISRNIEVNRLSVSKHTDSDMFEVSHSVQDKKEKGKSKETCNSSANLENVQLVVSSNVNNRIKGKENVTKNTEPTEKNVSKNVEKCTENNQPSSKDTKVLLNSHTLNRSNIESEKRTKNNKMETITNTETTASSHDTTKSIPAEPLSPLHPNFVFNGDTLIKLEDELQLTDNDEEAIWKGQDTISRADISPIKLKKIEQMPKTKFSVDNVVNLSDSEDDIFPCSQLFDIGFGMNASVKEEIKEENVEMDNERFKRLDDEDLVISVSDDSDEEDSNWLRRLSRSQTFNEDDEIGAAAEEAGNKIKEDMEIENLDVDDLIFDLNKDLNEDLDKSQSSSITKIETVKATRKSWHEEGVEEERMQIDSEDHMAIDIGTPNNQILPSRQESTENHLDISGSSSTEIIASSSRKKSLERKVPQIEALRLPSRTHRNRNKVQELPEKTTKKRLTAKQTKELREKSKIEQYELTKEQTIRKKLETWAISLPLNKNTRRTSLSKEEKKALAAERKEKLKKIAMEKKQASSKDDQTKKRTTTKPKAKVSMKTRSDLLVEDTIASLSEVAEKPSTSSSRHSRANKISTNSGTAESERNKDSTKEISTRLERALTLTELNKLGRIPKKSNNIELNTLDDVPQKSNPRTHKLLGDVSLMAAMEEVAKTNTSKKKAHGKSKAQSKRPVQNKPPLTSALSTPPKGQKMKKRVSFSTVLQTVREYQIEETNVLRKLTGKDAPLPPIRASRRVMENEKTHEFLLRIFTWNPVWLEEQVHLNSTPPVVSDNELHVMLTHYKSYDEYCRIISPLLLLETWYGITKEFQNIEQDFRRPTLMCSIVENSIQTNMKSPNVYLTTLMLEVLTTKQDIQAQAHPAYGDLVFFEYVKNHERGQTFHKIFAYVTDMHQTILTPWTHYNKDLRNYVKNPYALLTYTMITKPLGESIPVNRVQRLRAVTYLRSTLRMVRALECLPNSPLMLPILSPKIEMYHLPNVPVSEPLMTQDNLNQKQLEAVHKITDVIVQKQAKLCFIQGPPGTGKSKVIANIVTQVLYGNNRYSNNVGPLRILVCAPSNAAIDEITLRLLQIRSTMKYVNQKGFKMVRIGRSGVMHPVVKDISVTELAKREVKRTTSNVNNISADSVDEEKAFLESKMNALKCEIASTQNMDEVYRKHVRMKLEDITAKYELLKHRRPLNEINSRELTKIQREAESRVLSHADIITCTLSSCYNNQMESIFVNDKKRISVCIVDEATQSCETETLIPLMLGVCTLVLVGDPMQLPATVLSPQAKKLGLDQSIFSRVQNAFEYCESNPIIMLDTQYRMPYEISSWPNKFFYGSKLKTGITRNENFPFHAYRVLNINTSQDNGNFSNTDEAQFVANMIFSMMSFANLDKWECMTVGILTPYNNQKSIIQEKINGKLSLLSDGVKKKVKFEVNTVDGFQGQERDVIIMSCVRSQRIGFLSDKQRLCVALTRAKHSLILCGNFNVFMRDQMWNSLLSDAKSRKIFFNVNANADPQEIKVHVVKRFNC
ncbi:uncharacterized protein LOC128880140 [Hylaeus volcanicus]|uniref:uncharacterized protein LOC128880140 n=1 Tax=Hylaeus volcanicus TaxID=313075 RepID=UPI0023B86432|nr:uncharacterized protein LOC128880140 [Hylaeus volcanicus]